MYNMYNTLEVDRGLVASTVARAGNCPRLEEEIRRVQIVSPSMPSVLDDDGAILVSASRENGRVSAPSAGEWHWFAELHIMQLNSQITLAEKAKELLVAAGLDEQEAGRAAGLPELRAEARKLCVWETLWGIADPWAVPAQQGAGEYTPRLCWLLVAALAGTGGGWKDPGAGTARPVQFEAPSGLEAYTPGGGAARQRAQSGPAWSAALSGVAQLMLGCSEEGLALLVNAVEAADECPKDLSAEVLEGIETARRRLAVEVAASVKRPQWTGPSLARRVSALQKVQKVQRAVT